MKWYVVRDSTGTEVRRMLLWPHDLADNKIEGCTFNELTPEDGPVIPAPKPITAN